MTIVRDKANQFVSDDDFDDWVFNVKQVIAMKIEWHRHRLITSVFPAGSISNDGNPTHPKILCFNFLSDGTVIGGYWNQWIWRKKFASRAEAEKAVVKRIGTIYDGP